MSNLNSIHVLIPTIFLTWIRPFKVSNTPIHQESTYTLYIVIGMLCIVYKLRETLI